MITTIILILIAILTIISLCIKIKIRFYSRSKCENCSYICIHKKKLNSENDLEQPNTYKCIKCGNIKFGDG